VSFYAVGFRFLEVDGYGGAGTPDDPSINSAEAQFRTVHPFCSFLLLFFEFVQLQAGYICITRQASWKVSLHNVVVTLYKDIEI